MAATPVLNNVSAVRFQQARVMNVANLTMIVTPQFTQDQIALLQQNPEAAIRSIDQNLWLTLAGWLDAPLSAVVQCRRSGLTVQLNRRSGISGTLLPTDAGSPSGTLRYKLPNGAQQQRTLQTLLDATNGYLRLTLLFENSSLYDEVLTAMTTPAGEAFIDVAFVHLYQLKVPAQQTPEVDPRVVLRPRRRRAEPIMRTMPATVDRTRFREVAVARSPDANLEAANVRLANADMRRVTLVAQPTQGDPSVPQDRSYSGKLAVPLTHARTETAVFPDLPRQSQNGWGQVPRNTKLHFRDSGRVDTFYYLPTSFKLGYYFEKEGGAAGARPPLRVELYRDADGNERIKATIVALPCIEDAERAALRTFLRDNLLQGVQPFIFLEPRSGLQAKFVDDFSAGSASDQRTLPAEISLQVLEVASADRMVLRFDMPALKYPIFCELLKAGIFGRVLLTENGLEAQVEVRLQLEDIVTNLVQIEQGGPAEQPASSSVPPEASSAPRPESSPPGRRPRRGRRPTFQDMIEIAAAASSQRPETSSGSREGGRLTLQDILEIAARASSERGETPSSDTPSSETPSSDTPSSGAGSSGSPPSTTPPPPNGTSLTIRNLLDCGLKISSLTLSLLDLGELSGMVFEAEDLRLLPRGAELPAQADAGSVVSFTVRPKRLIAWDETVVEAGQIKVLGGSADDWLNRVNRDPSLQQHEFKVQLQLIVPAGIRDRVQLVRLRLLKDGDATIRSRMDLLPESPSPVLQVPMTLQELMGTGGKTPSFSIEYETLAADGNLSLTQRLGIAPGMGAVILRAIVQTPNTLFTVEYQTEAGTVREELDRQAAEQLISKLSRNAQHWEIFTKEPEPTSPDQPPDTPPPDTRDTTSPSAEVTIVTDLAKIAFSNGALTRIFVVLKPDQEAGPQSSFVFDSSNQGPTTWRPQGFTVPPFRYEITYLYTGNQIRQVNGSSSNLVLVLDPPPPS
jgi:hypothetical protein